MVSINTEKDAQKFTESASLYDQWSFDGYPEDPSDVEGFDKASELYDKILKIINSKEYTNV